MTAARSTPSTALTMPEPACACCLFSRQRLSAADLLLLGAELGRRGAELSLCPVHAAAAVQVCGHVALKVFGVAARVEPRLASSQRCSPARKRRRRTWLARESS